MQGVRSSSLLGSIEISPVQSGELGGWLGGFDLSIFYFLSSILYCFEVVIWFFLVDENALVEFALNLIEQFLQSLYVLFGCQIPIGLVDLCRCSTLSPVSLSRMARFCISWPDQD